jgi:hypothetical protein
MPTTASPAGQNNNIFVMATTASPAGLDNIFIMASTGHLVLAKRSTVQLLRGQTPSISALFLDLSTKFDMTLGGILSILDRDPMACKNGANPPPILSVGYLKGLKSIRYQAGQGDLKAAREY